MAKKQGKQDEDSMQSYGSLNSKYIAIIVILVALFAGIVLLLSDLKPITGFSTYNSSLTQYYMSNPDKAKSEYNSLSDDQIPSTVRYIFGNEFINIKFIRFDSQAFYLKAKTENGKIISLEGGSWDVTTRTFYLEMNEATLKKIVESDNVIDQLNTELDNGGIKYGSFKFTTGVKMAILDAVISVWSWFT